MICVEKWTHQKFAFDSNTFICTQTLNLPRFIEVHSNMADRWKLKVYAGPELPLWLVWLHLDHCPGANIFVTNWFVLWFWGELQSRYFDFIFWSWTLWQFIDNKLTCKEVVTQRSYLISDPLSHNTWKQGCLYSRER